MKDYQSVEQRREKIMNCINKSVYKHSDIANIVGVDIETVRNDIKFLKEQTKPWFNYLVGQNGMLETCYLARQKVDYLMELAQKEIDAAEHPLVKAKFMEILEKLIKLGLSIDLKGPILTAIQQSALSRVTK